VPRTEPSTALLAHDVRETLARLVRRLRDEPGPSVGRMLVLIRLDRDGPASISDLAAAERVRPQSMAQTVRELEAAGHVRRLPDPADGRRVSIELTADGAAALRAAREARETWLTRALESELDADERALLREALGLLDRLADG